jgi:hypothetical protein
VSNARHSHDSPEWYSPSNYVEAARRVMGVIDLDPASHPEANVHIRARRIYTAADDGLSRKWRGRIFLNPPGGFVPEFWIKLLEEYRYGRVDQAIWIGYSLEQIQTLQNVEDIDRIPIEFMTCYPRARIAFIENAAKRRRRMRKLRAEGKIPNKRSQPSHGNYVTHLGDNRAGFRREFKQFGKVISGR